MGDIWTAYLTTFVERYGGSKLERARDLFEQVRASLPAAARAGIHSPRVAARSLA